MASSAKNFLTAEEVEQVDTWQLPEFGWNTAKVPSAEKEAREKKRREKERAAEVVEDIPAPKPLSAQELDALRQAAEAEGYQEGLKRGVAEGEPQGREAGRAQAYRETLAEQQKLLAHLNQLIDQFSGPLVLQRSELSMAIATLVERLTRQVVYSELSTPGPHLENLVQACLDALPALKPGSRPVVEVNPDDLAYLRGEAALAGLLERCEWRAETDLRPGGCRVRTAASVVDGQVESRLTDLFKAFHAGELAPAEATDEAVGDGGGQALEDADDNGAPSGRHTGPGPEPEGGAG